MNSAEDDLEAAMWAALTRHKVTCERANELLADLLEAAFAYAAGDSDALTTRRRMVLNEATAPGPGHGSPSTATGGRPAHPRELNPSGSRAGRPEGATLSTGRSIPPQVKGGLPQAVDNALVDMVDEKSCPTHGQTLVYVDPQPDDDHPACLLECGIFGCDYQTREAP